MRTVLGRYTFHGMHFLFHKFLSKRNTLSSQLRRSSVSLDSFKRSLKTFLYNLYKCRFGFCRHGSFCDDVIRYLCVFEMSVYYYYFSN